MKLTPDGHHQVPQPNQRTVIVREHSHDDVVLKDTNKNANNKQTQTTNEKKNISKQLYLNSKDSLKTGKPEVKIIVVGSTLV